MAADFSKAKITHLPGTATIYDESNLDLLKAEVDYDNYEFKDAWQELKETITELRDNDGTGTQQEVCKFLVNYMGVLERQVK